MEDKQAVELNSLQQEVKALGEKLATLKPVVISFQNKAEPTSEKQVSQSDFESYEAETKRRLDELELKLEAIYATLEAKEKAKPIVKEVVVAPQVIPVPVATPKESKKEIAIVRRSFCEKMLTASDETISNYNALRNFFASYPDVASRLSLPCESYRAHRKLYAKILCCQKTLKLYLALNPKSYLHSTIPVEDASKRKDYVDVPCLLRIQSSLSLRRGEKLIAEMLSQAGYAPKKEGPGHEDYAKQVRDQGRLEAAKRQKKEQAAS
jgi:hypothetical protein